MRYPPCIDSCSYMLNKHNVSGSNLVPACSIVVFQFEAPVASQCCYDCFLSVVNAFREPLESVDSSRPLIPPFLAAFPEIVFFKMTVVTAYLCHIPCLIGSSSCKIPCDAESIVRMGLLHFESVSVPVRDISIGLFDGDVGICGSESI